MGSFPETYNDPCWLGKTDQLFFIRTLSKDDSDRRGTTFLHIKWVLSSMGIKSRFILNCWTEMRCVALDVIDTY